jgi:hypothetical protein
VPSWAAEGSTVAGPVGGTDIRSAFHASPGLYGAIITGGSLAYQLRDGSGNPRAGLNAVGINAVVGGLAFVYVPNFKLFDGSVAFLGVTGMGDVCGQITSANPRRCMAGRVKKVRFPSGKVSPLAPESARCCPSVFMTRASSPAMA